MKSNIRAVAVAQPVVDQPKATLQVSRPGRKSMSPESFGVVAQVREALKPKNRLAALLGFCLGAIVPFASYIVAHFEIDPEKPIYLQLGTFLVLGGLIYSAKTVYSWGVLAFNSRFKAVGFVLLLEGVMVAAHTTWLSVVTLVYLVAINGIATGCNLSVRQEKP
jgi:hypothetical protein